MKWFYEGFDAKGTPLLGDVEANSQSEAATLIRERGHFAREISDSPVRQMYEKSAPAKQDWNAWAADEKRLSEIAGQMKQEKDVFVPASPDDQVPYAEFDVEEKEPRTAAPAWQDPRTGATGRSDFWDMTNAPGWFVEKWLAMNNKTIMGSTPEELVELEVAWRQLWANRALK